jgi:hypothetical protein
MSPPAEPGEHLSPAEARLAEHLALVRATPPAGDVALVRRVVRAARVQRALREPLRLMGSIAAAAVDGLRGLFGVRRGGGG